MKIEEVDFFYLRMPEVLDIGDGSQDALLVRIRAGGYEGWGECEASPLPTIAAYDCPMSHSACKPVRSCVEGMPLYDIEDIHRINDCVHESSYDLLQADHTLSGIDIALWDLLGKYLQEPVYRLLGYNKAYPKLAYASQLFGDTPEETFQKARNAKSDNFLAVKFGWGSFGKGSATADADHLMAAREGLGPDIRLMVDAGTAWREDTDAAKQRLQALNEVKVHWLEEPFVNLALESYRSLSETRPQVPLAAGEGCHNYMQAAAMIVHAGLQFIQIDTGRIGGITVARRVAELAAGRGLSFVNHTFTSHLALSASLQPYAGKEKSNICEYPVEARMLATSVTREKIIPDDNGMISVPERPGLGMTVDTESIKKYLVDAEIRVDKRILYQTPAL